MSLVAAEPAYAQVSSLKTQIPFSSTPTAITIDSVDALKNFAVGPNKDQLIAKEEGVYFLIASGQCGSVNKSDTGYMDLWFVKNGAAIPNSNCRLTVDRSTSIGILVTQFLIKLSKGDTISTNFSASGPSLGFIFTQPDNEPANTSFLLSIFKVE